MTDLKLVKDTSKLSEENNNLQVLSSVNAFAGEVAKYFMDFLETDFHKRRLPKRSVQFRNGKLDVGIKLKKYPKYNALIWKAINESFVNNITPIKKKSFVTRIPDALLDLIDKQIENIEEGQIEEIITFISIDIATSVSKHKKEADVALDETLESTEKILREKLISPFIQTIEKPLESLASANVDSIYLMEEDLTDIFIDHIDNKISEVINLLIAGEDVEIANEIASILTIESTKYHLASFFKSFAIKDLFTEVSNLFNNKSLLEKQQFYLYFCDVTFNNLTFPVFYIPVSIERIVSAFNIEFDTVVYINKKAIDYVVQEYTKAYEKKGSLKARVDRVIYLTEEKGHLTGTLDGILKEISDFVELPDHINFGNPEEQIIKGMLVSISNDCHLCLFDKSDEALINDYEEMLGFLESGDNILASSFNETIDNFIGEEPESFIKIVEDEWDKTEAAEKLVYSSPIPLNDEQRQIIAALKKKNCKYITVEGPPGTGKSHTITAIVFNAILDGQSVLVLSDKKEALDVIENKITETMNKVRIDENFQNPVLRLGKTGNTYNKILSTSSINSIKTHHRASKKEAEVLEKRAIDTKENLKNLIKISIDNYDKIKIENIQEFHLLEVKVVDSGNYSLDFNELFNKKDAEPDLINANKMFGEFYNLLDSGNAVLHKVFTNMYKGGQTVANFKNFVALLGIVSELKAEHRLAVKFLDRFSTFNEELYKELNLLINDYTEIRHDWFGYLFSRSKLKELNRTFLAKLPARNIDSPHRVIPELKAILGYYNEAIRHNENKSISIGFNSGENYFKNLHQLSTNEIITLTKDETARILGLINIIDMFVTKYPSTSGLLGIDFSDIESLYKNKLFEMDEKKFNNLIRFINIKQELERLFEQIPNYSYNAIKSELEEYSTIQMTHIMDKRVIDFCEENRNTVKTLKGIIKSKKRFPKDEFLKLKSAFPCILAGIRDFAEYIPLEPDLFDIVIIDEASQVSIAQAFPALLRAKKIIVLGDQMQFSNIKSAHASTDTNKEYLNRLEKTFRETISQDQAKLERMAKFNIKTSILEFFDHITNYNIRLLKHFRGYKELISYSSEHFYGDDLQAIKIRGKSIDEVIKFDILEHDGKIEPINNTNKPEIEFIITELRRLLDENQDYTVGIITPHTNQQKMLVESIAEIPEREELYDKLKLKIMTFDTCQGEERDIIIYSMVASPVEDSLRWIFIKDLKSIDLEAEGKIKAQRLNVGFSRVKECMHFVCSKPIEDYSGSIGEALRWYKKTLDEGHEMPEPGSVDPKSPMEVKVLDWLQQTAFFKANRGVIELKAQFHLGEYLKQLDKYYNHPKFVVDFLMIYREGNGRDQKIIIEYDGFEGHFKRVSDMGEHNYFEYYTDEHIYREKVLESYGYKFIRINRFNIGKNPIDTLSERLEEVVKKKPLNT